MDDDEVVTEPQTITRAELAELADGLKRLFDAIEAGQPACRVGSGGSAGGGVVGVEALAAGRPLTTDELLRSRDTKENDRTPTLPEQSSGLARRHGTP